MENTPQKPQEKANVIEEFLKEYCKHALRFLTPADMKVRVELLSAYDAHLRARVEELEGENVRLKEHVDVLIGQRDELEAGYKDLKEIQAECDHDWDSVWNSDLQKIDIQKCKTCKTTRPY